MSDREDMPPGWKRDVDVDERHVRALLAELPPPWEHLHDADVGFVAEGWDNSVWRVGPELAARIPVRPLAAPLLVNEAHWGDVVTEPLREQGVAMTRPVHLSSSGSHPHPWLLVSWVEGDLLDDVPVASRTELAGPLASALDLLHRPAPAQAPLNPFRGPDLRELPEPRPSVVAAARDELGDAAVDSLLAVHAGAVGAAPWPAARVWCHGDLHPRNLVRTSSGGLGLLDFGDLTAGDPAVDLSVWWTTFDADQRSPHLDALPRRYDPDLVTRARGWAARFALGVAGNGPGPFATTIHHTLHQLTT